MVQVFDNGWDEKVVHKDISGTSSDNYIEIGGRVYDAYTSLTPQQKKALKDDIDADIDRYRI